MANEKNDAIIANYEEVARVGPFAMLKIASRWLFRNAKTQQGILPTLFSRSEIKSLVARLGGRYERIEESAWHPFHNTCVDYRLRF